MIELLVAMVIGLIGVIIIFQVFEVSEGIKRTTTSGGDAQQNGAIAMYVLEHDVRNSGMGFNDTPWAGCSIVGWDNTLTPSTLPPAGATMLMAPVRIFPGANSWTPDSVNVFYGSQTHSASASKLEVTMNLATDPVRVKNIYGYHIGDLIVVMEPGGAPPKSCSLMEVTAINGDQMLHDSGNYLYTAPGGTPTSVPSRFNKPGGLGITYTEASASTVVYNLGSAQGGPTTPVYSNYQILNNTLTVTAAFSTGNPPAVADNIVHMRVMYGLDDGGNNGTVTYNTTYADKDYVIDRWVDAATPPVWEKVKAIRLAVVARSILKEKPSGGVGAACDTTIAEPTWTGSAWAGPPWNFNTRLDLSKNPDGTPNPDWQCYRYRVFEATIPLRNWVWSSS
jgi:type IV pilus assembly protein PilW